MSAASSVTVTQTRADTSRVACTTSVSHAHEDVSACKNSTCRPRESAFPATDVTFGSGAHEGGGGGTGALAGGLGFGFFLGGGRWWFAVGGLSLREQSSRSPSERLSVSAHSCCVQQLRHALGDAALVARQHRNVGGRVSCP